MKSFIWWDDGVRSAASQMAIDTAMPRWARAHHCILIRLYQWRVDTLSLGTHEAAQRTWDRAALERDGIAVVRRPTGGRGVWHAATDLTYAWAGPVGDVRGARAKYREVHRVMAQSLMALGHAASIAEPGAVVDLAPASCFSLAAGGEVLVAGRKTIGSAQRIWGDHALQHGAIARSDHSEAESRYLLAQPATARSSRQSGFSSRAEVPEPLPDAAILAEQVSADWSRLGAHVADKALTRGLEAASLEYLPQFLDPDWTWRR